MCTLEKRGNVYILTITGDGEHRLNPTLLDSLHAAVRRLKSFPATPSSTLITTSHGKFFSNGYDLNWAKMAPGSELSNLVVMSNKLRSLVSDLISLPMPTIAAVTGHAAAAGMVLALAHDYVFMRKERGFLYMSEMDIGMVLPRWFLTMFECRVGGGGRVMKEVVMEARKLTAETAAARGVVDRVCGGAEATVAEAVAFGEELVRRKWNGHVYASNRMVVLRHVLEHLAVDETVEERFKVYESKL